MHSSVDVITRLAQYSILEGKSPHNYNRLPGPHILAYVRVSTKHQVKEGHSIEAQRQIINNHIQIYKLIGHLKFYEDHAISGKDMKNRPGFQEMVSYMRSGDIIISYSLSRLGRNTQEILNFADKLEREKINLVIIDTKIDTSNAAGKLFFTMMAAMGQFEREQVSERTKAVMNHRKEGGFLVTRPPFGYTVNKETKKLVPLDEEQKVVTLIVGLIFENPDIKDSQITKILQARFIAGEITWRDSKRVYQTAVRNVIKRHNIRELVQKQRASGQLYIPEIPIPTIESENQTPNLDPPIETSDLQVLPQMQTTSQPNYYNPLFYPQQYPYTQPIHLSQVNQSEQSTQLNLSTLPPPPNLSPLPNLSIPDDSSILPPPPDISTLPPPPLSPPKLREPQVVDTKPLTLNISSSTTQPNIPYQYPPNYYMMPPYMYPPQSQQIPMQQYSQYQQQMPIQPYPQYYPYPPQQYPANLEPQISS